MEQNLWACVVFIHSYSKHSLITMFVLVLPAKEGTWKRTYLCFHDQTLKREAECIS